MRLSRVLSVTAALVLGAALSVVPLQVAGAQSPSTSVLVPSNGATLSGSTYLDASASNATGAEFLLFGGTYGYAAPVVCTATQTYYGWLCSWNTTTVPNGSYALVSEASGADGNTFSKVTITVDNVSLATQMLIPATGPWVVGINNGTVLLDASAQGSYITGVQFVVSFGPVVDEVVATATPTLYGWIGEWDLATQPVPSAPPGASLQSVVTQAGGATAMSASVEVLEFPG